MKKRIFGYCLATVAMFAVLASPLQARDLTVGLQAVVSSMDPHFHNTTQNNSMSRHIFETLVLLDKKMELKPGLALSWKNLGKDTWEVKLRPGVKWHDGSPFTAGDVDFTIKRAANVPNSPSSFGSVTRSIKDVRIVDPLTIVLTTVGPHPLLPRDLSLLPIVSKKFGDKATTEDYNSGKATVGTGPYKFTEFKANSQIVLTRNDEYWGEKEPWTKATFRFLSAGSARVASMLSSEVDLIEVVPPADIQRFEKDTRFNVVSGPSNRMIYLHMDSNRDVSPFVTDTSGKPLQKNPLKDAKVRKAISLAMNRQAIVGSMLDGKGTPAGQYMPDGSFGNSKTVKADVQDVVAAKKLLTEAGYPQGFQITLHGPNNRYVNDAAVSQVIAQLLTKIGIITKVEAMPASVYFTRASRLDFSLMLVGWGGADVQESVMVLKALIMTFDKDKGTGYANRGRYSNPAVDSAIEEAGDAFELPKRAELTAKAVDMAVKDTAIVPLYFEFGTWAMKKNVKFQARVDQYTTAMDIR